MVAKLNDTERKTGLAALKDWQAAEGRDAIRRSFKFKNFSEGLGIHESRWRCSPRRRTHHPEWSNVYSPRRSSADHA